MGCLLRLALDNSLPLLAGTSAALLWANLDPGVYQSVSEPLHFVVNEIGMVFFFALAAKEVCEALLPAGPLASLSRAALPLMATVGGMVGPASLYLLGAWFFGHNELARGWAIPCATDIAFSYLTTRAIFGAKHPAVIFLLLLALADDALGLVILASFYPTSSINLFWLALLAGGGVGLGLLLKKTGWQSFWIYLFGPGVLTWIGFYLGGIHPALALVPVVFCMPHESRDLGIFDDREVGQSDTLSRLERWWKDPVQVILGLFGFANAGVELTATGPATWLVLGGLLLGKPLGILLATRLGALFGLRLPDGIGWKDLSVVSAAASIGFTVALFVSTVAFAFGTALDHAKMGALLSLVAAPLSIILAKILGVKKRRLHRLFQFS
ncbi:MAG TPA: Na+/H+ antiporter NhaA [Acidobacteriota bacterium]|jgi:NhaA family Na+:H+ antiporter